MASAPSPPAPSQGRLLMPAGRPRLHAGNLEARRAANARAAQHARARGIVQRSVALPAACWSLLRAARADGETSDAQTLARIIGGG